MLVVCPNCSSSYFVRSETLGGERRMMRCGVCRSTFQAEFEPKSAETPKDFLKSAIKAPQFANEPHVTPPPAPKQRGRRFGMMAAGIAGFTGLLAVIGGVAQDFDRLKAQTGQWIAGFLPGLVTPRLAIQNIKTRFEGEGADRALIIEGMILSDASAPHNLPSLNFEIRSAAGDGPVGESIFQWMIPPPAPTIDRGNPVPFRARLASPPREGKDIVIRLAGA
jgi:predicted Zn finger-like uncharacterized protein